MRSFQKSARKCLLSMQAGDKVVVPSAFPIANGAVV